MATHHRLCMAATVEVPLMVVDLLPGTGIVDGVLRSFRFSYLDLLYKLPVSVQISMKLYYHLKQQIDLS
jgi:hypothetical protein